MPTYQYRCGKCNHEFETEQRIVEDPLKDCPKCSMPELKRIIGGSVGIAFKGGGFYINDSKKNQKTKTSGGVNPSA